MTVQVLIIHGGADTGGQAYRIARAFDQEAGWQVRAAIGNTNYIAYPRDLPWRTQVIRSSWRTAQVVHLMNTFHAYDRHQRLGRRPIVIHHHGTHFRTAPGPLLAEQGRRRAVGLVSTIDLWMIAPEQTEWLPAPYDLDWLAGMRRPHRRRLVRIAHAPTDRAVKDTAGFLAAVHRLQAEGHAVEVDLIERVSWEECLRRKASADVFYDQCTLGYGNNAIEAWGMGIPVIAGVDPAAAAAIGHAIPEGTLAEMQRRFGRLPFYPATPTTLYEALKAMVESAELRAEYAAIGLEHARRWHAEKRVVAQLKDAYRRAYELHHGAAPGWAA